MRRTFMLFIALLGFRALLAAQPVERLVVEPDVLASQDTSAPHVELILAASPLDARRLLAAGIVDHRTKTYLSVDGGHTWSAHEFDDPAMVTASDDPQTLYTPKGTALFITLAEGKSPDGRATSLCLAFRSEDGGTTWGPRIEIGQGLSWDRPVVAAGAHGPLYVVASTVEKGIYESAFFRSDDDGRTFTAPHVFARAPENVAMTALGVAPLGGGKVAAIWMQTADFITSTMFSVVSNDGGETWSAAHPVVTYMVPKETAKKLSRYSTWPVFTADETGIYGTWTDMRDGTPRVVFTSSRDGVTWTEPRRVEEGTAPQYAPMIAAAGRGTIGITWLDARELNETGAYRVRFAASLDGGRSFLPSKVISSAVSHALGQGNIAPAPAAFVDHRGIQRIAFLSTVGRFFAGGDFSGLAADREGVFHPFWADSRTGTFQAWTTRVRVAREPATPCETQKAPADVSKRVTLVADPVSFGPGAGEISIPFRLRNDSTIPIGGPLTVEVLGFGDGPKADMNQEWSPTIENAANNKTGAGALFDYSKTLGDLCDLPPGGITEAVIWRFHMKDVTQVPQMSVVVKGVVRE
jgi:hypothetical protein